MLDVVRRVEQALREGYRPAGMAGAGKAAIAIAAERAVHEGAATSINTFVSRVQRSIELGHSPDWSLYRPQRYQQPVPRAVITHAPPPRGEPPEGGEKVLVIGDLHQDPRHPDRLQVLTLIARRASETRPSRVIQIGDWSTWDSVSQHDRNDTQSGKVKPSIRSDMDNLEASLKAWEAGRSQDYKPKLNVTLGNHENRLERFENANPEAYETFTLERDQLFSQFGWRTRPFGEVLYVEGVGFTHHPTNGVGRAFGGETGPQRAANKATCPIVSGHTHRRAVFDAGKIGPQESISMVEVGCALPWGTIEAYARHSLTSWWYGVVEMTVAQGVITDLNFVSMLALQRYQ